MSMRRVASLRRRARIRRSSRLCLALLSACQSAAGGWGELGVFELDAGNGAPHTGHVSPRADQVAHARSEIGALVLDVVRVDCTNGCTEVLAAARGGNPPYSFQWQDGLTAERRRICPHELGQLTLSVTDTTISDVGFRYTAQTVWTAVSEDVVSCSTLDAGSGEPVLEQDSGAAQEQPSRCVQGSIAAGAAAGCQSLLPAADCYAAFREPLRRSYELPTPLAPGGSRCLVALGNTRDLPDSLSFFVSGEEARCEALSETLRDPQASPAPYNEAGQAQVICLQEPSRAYSSVAITLSTYTGEFGDLELRLCEQCPR